VSENQTANGAHMHLRAEPPPVTRLSRKVLAGIGLVASLGIGGALIYALQSRTTKDDSKELYSTSNRQPADGLASLPRDYTGPILGPPLPGDLGRPIVDAQNNGQPVTLPTIMTPTVDRTEERRLAEQEAARVSRVFFQTAPGSAAPTNGASGDMSTPGFNQNGQFNQPTAQDKQLAFLNAPVDRRTTSPDRVMPPTSPFVLQAGAVISAALITGIRSDLPGQISAQVTENAYDSPTGRILLIPQGTRLIGQYDNNVQFGQRRVLLVWNRLIFPNGRSIVLERQPGADTQGYAGLEDGVDYHWLELFKAAALSTLLSVGAEAGTSNNENSLIQALRSGASNSISQTGQLIVQRQLNIAPTLTIRPGFPVRVVVSRDLVFEAYKG